MFIPCRVDVVRYYRPIMSYVLIAAMLILFAVSRGRYPFIAAYMNTDHLALRILFAFVYLSLAPLLGIFHAFITLAMIGSFGRAICEKRGNVIFIVFYGSISIIASMVCGFMSLPPVIGMSVAINAILGFHMAMYPSNAVTCRLFPFIPPISKEFTVSGFWIILAWLFLDAITSLFSDCPEIILLNGGLFVLSTVVTLALLKIGLIQADEEDVTLLHVFGVLERQDSAWEDSWTERKKHIKPAGSDDDEPAASPLPLRQPESGRDQIRVLCQCGSLIDVPADTNQTTITCPDCSGKVHLHP